MMMPPSSANAGVTGRQVQRTFNRVTGYYDRMNRVMTLGRHRAWCREVAARAQLSAGDRLLDLATGTGDIALAAKAAQPGAQVTGADFATAMLEQARSKPGAQEITWQFADAHELPFADDAFDCVTHGYLLRNVQDVPLVLREQRRVLVEGGRLVVLETCRPSGPLRPVLTLGIKIVIPTLGWLIARDRESYAYLEESTLSFRTPEEVAQSLREAGFTEIGWSKKFLGTNVIMWARAGTAVVREP